MTLFVESPNKYIGRRAPLLWVVVHSTEGNEVDNAALNLAKGWFGSPASQVSAHAIADAGGVVECVKPGDTAWHCANGNASGYGMEIVGKAAQSVIDWNDRYSVASLDQAARWLRSLPALEHIPRRWLSDTELARREPGFVTHYQVSKVLGGTNHTDPGPNFPYGVLMDGLGSVETTAAGTSKPPAMPALPTVRYGEHSEQVKRMQLFLIRVFPTYARFTATGFYGDQTQAAVAVFQARAGVTGPDADGSIVGRRTNAALARYGYRG